MATKTIDILDYKGNKKTVELDLDNIRLIDLMILSGDEILIVTYKDGTVKDFDSSSCRAMSFFDGSYPVYDPETDFSLLEDPGWLARKSSYDY